MDEKGRVAIPAGLRATLDRNSGDPESRIVVVGTNPIYPCLRGHDESWSDEQLERINRAEALPFDKEDSTPVQTRRQAFGMTEAVPYDPSGRFVLPPFYRHKAGIRRWAFFIGVGEIFEIWSPEKLLATTDEVNAEFRELCAYQLETKGVTL